MMGAAHDFQKNDLAEGDHAPNASEVLKATMRLPERQREALTLREQKGLSYEEIGAIVETSRDSVAQLIARARINLYDELRGTALASMAPSPDCERALSLIAMREDDQLAAFAADGDWLEAHLAECDRCRLGEKQMSEAAAAYRSAPPLAVADAAPAQSREHSETSGPATETTAKPAGQRTPAGGSRRRMTFLAASVALLLLLTGLAMAVTGGGESTPVSPAAGAATGQDAGGTEPGAKSARPSKAKSGAAKRRRKARAKPAGSTTAAASGETPAAEVTPISGSSSPLTGGGGPGESAPASRGASGKTAVEPTQQTAAPKPSSKPKPAPTSATTPQATTTTTTTAPAPAPPPSEAPVDGPGRSEEAPGKPDKDPKQ